MATENDSVTLISEEPWPKDGINHYKSSSDGQWGYLLQFSDGRFRFDESRKPQEDEIMRRWGPWLSK